MMRSNGCRDVGTGIAPPVFEHDRAVRALGTFRAFPNTKTTDVVAQLQRDRDASIVQALPVRDAALAALAAPHSPPRVECFWPIFVAVPV
jgi:hypothetical protein